MKRTKQILHALVFPPIALFLLLVPLSFALLVYAFVFADGKGILSYFAYSLSAYTLAVLCTQTPRLIRFFRKIQRENHYIKRYLQDEVLRIRISLYSGLFVSTVYAVFQLGLGCFHRSLWFCALAAYYILLTLVRFFLLRDIKSLSEKKDLVAEYKRYRFCGILLLAMHLVLAVIVAYITRQNRGLSHHPVTTIAIATYTFGALTMAIITLVKYRKYQHPLLSAATITRLAAASVSLLTLETAMFSAFGAENSERLRQIMTAATGTCICLFFLLIALYMILHATKQLKYNQIQSR